MAARKNHRGAYRTAVAYVLIVMAGTLVVILPALGILGNFFDKSYAHTRHIAQPGILAVVGAHLKLFLRLVGSFVVLLWLFAGALIYVFGLGLQKLKVPILSRLILAAISGYLSCKIILMIAPVGWPSLFSVYFTFFWTGILGAAFGFFVYPWIGKESFQIAPLGRAHWALVGAWALYLVVAYGYTAYAFAKVHTLNDPGIDLVFFKWTPSDGEVREEPNGKYDSYFPRMRDVEINELRAGGITGVLQGWGNNTLPGPGANSRVVLIMSRPTRETIDLPKPASGDMIYIQTEQGWKAFPPSTPTLHRSMRLTISEPNEHHTLPDTVITADIGFGHPNPELGLHTFSWFPQEFQAPLPSLPDQKPTTK
jgi:hypothetical protein